MEEISGIVQAEQKLRHRRLRFAIGLPDQNKNAFSGSRQLTQTIQKATKREESPQTREQAKKKRLPKKNKQEGNTRRGPKRKRRKKKQKTQKKKKGIRRERNGRSRTTASIFGIMPAHF